MKRVVLSTIEYIKMLSASERVEFIEELAEQLEENREIFMQDSDDFTNSSSSGYSLGDTNELIDISEELKLVPNKDLIASLHVRKSCLMLSEDMLFLTFNDKKKLIIRYTLDGQLVELAMKGKHKTQLYLQILHVLGSKVEYLSTEKAGTEPFDRFLVNVNVPQLSEIVDEEYIFTRQQMNLELCVMRNGFSWISQSTRKEKYYESMRTRRNISIVDKHTENQIRMMDSVMESGVTGIYDVNGNLEMQNAAIESAVSLLENYAPELLLSQGE